MRCRGSRLLRLRRCGDFGLVSRHKPAGTSLRDVSAIPDFAASRISRRRAAAKSTPLTRRGAAAISTPLTRRGAAARSTPLTRRGAAARSTPLTAPVVASMSWPERGHHVPALTVTSGGRGVGFDMHAWGRLTIAHSRRHLNPRASSLSCFSYLIFLLRLATPALKLGVISGSWRPCEACCMQYDVTDAGPASHRVRLWQGGLASILISSSGSS